MKNLAGDTKKIEKIEPKIKMHIFLNIYIIFHYGISVNSLLCQISQE